MKLDSNNNITTLVLDVDGVINGSLIGINTPFPSKVVIDRLKQFSDGGGQIILCTAKGVYPIAELVETNRLGGIHICDAGGIIYDSSAKSYVVENVPGDLTKTALELFTQSGNYFEVYTAEDWYIPSGFRGGDSERYIAAHTDLLRKEPIEIEDFEKFAKIGEVSKFLYFTEDEIDSEQNQLLQEQLTDCASKWTISPVLHPANLFVVTKKGISKQSALEKLANKHEIDLSKAVGVGDHDSDWAFMRLCGFRGIMGNGTEKLKELGKAEPASSVAFGGDVDNDGLVDIMDKFGV